jgi:hypothetical protein
LIIILVPLIVRAKKAAAGGRMLRGFDWSNYRRVGLSDVVIRIHEYNRGRS